jgi:hypothetical protein
MKKLKGPDLKMPELKVPPFGADLYYDLRDRRLLPLVGLILVAIVAVPILLASSSEPKPVPVGPAPKPAGASASALTVVQATPGLRDYRKRLRGRTPTDPFKQPSAPNNPGSAQLGTAGNNGFEESEVSSTTSTTTTSSGTTVKKETTKSSGGGSTTKTTETEVKTPSSPSGGGGENGNPGGQQPGEIKFYSFAIDAKITRTEEDPETHKTTTTAHTRSEILAPAPLPSAKEQAVTYAGINPKTKNPLFLVSDAVTSVFGEATCISGEEKCQLLEAETGMPMTFVLGDGKVRVKLNVLKVQPVLKGHF